MQLILVIFLLALAIGGIAIKMFVKPGAAFTKTCGSSFDPKTGRPNPCSCHSSGNETVCDNETGSRDTQNHTVTSK